MEQLLIVAIILLLYFVGAGSCGAQPARHRHRQVAAPPPSQPPAPSQPSPPASGEDDWNQYIRDEAQRVVYTKNHIVRGGQCFPELVGWPAGDAATYIKGKCPELYVVLNDERVPQRLDIWFTQPNRVVLTFDARGLVSRIPMTG